MDYVQELTPKQAAVEYALKKWAGQRREHDAVRDDLVRGAVAAGVTKHRVYVLTGIARTTIDRIVRQAEG